MATTGKEYQQELEELAKRESHLRARTATLAAEEAETRKALEAVSEEKRSKLGNALDAMKKRYFQRLLRGRGVKVLAPRLVGVEERTLGKVTRSEEHTSEIQSRLHFIFPLFFFNDPATTEIYTLSLHDALPI